MSCSGEVVEEDDRLIQIKPAISEQLKKQSMELQIIQQLNYVIGQKNHSSMKEVVTNTSFMEFQLIDVWNFLLQVCIVKIRCVYCWRPMEFYDSLKMEPEQVAEPKEILEKLMAERKKLINGYYGDSRNDKERLDESLLPSHYAISLSGEPTMYPKLPELIKYLNSLEATKSIFLVTNGQEPDMIQRLQDENALPTQLYLSTNAADYESFMNINKPKYDDSWERWNRSWTC